jgi:hypothetical protein
MQPKRPSNFDLEREKVAPDTQTSYQYEWSMPQKAWFRRAKRVNARLEEITLGQEVELMTLLRRYDFATLEDFKKELALGQLLDNLIQSGDIYRVFQILLTPRLTIDQIKAMPFTVQVRVIGDFFVLNPGLTILFRSFVAGKEFSREQPKKTPNDSPPSD